MRFFKKLGGRPKIKKRHKFKSITLKQTGWELKNNRITLNFRKWERGKWRYDRVPYTFHKHRQWHGCIRRITQARRLRCLLVVYHHGLHRPETAANNRFGADFGKDAYLTLSTGEKKQHPQPLKHSLKNFALNNRKQKGSNGGVSDTSKISNQRKDFPLASLPLNFAKRFDIPLKP